MVLVITNSFVQAQIVLEGIVIAVEMYACEMHTSRTSNSYKLKKPVEANLDSTPAPTNDNLAPTLLWEKKTYILINSK